MVPNPPNTPHPEIGLISSSQVGDTQPTLLTLRITVLRAYNLPRLKTLLGKKGRFYVTVTFGERAWRSRSVRSVAQRVEWNESSDAFAVQPPSRITISLYAEKITRKDILIGKQEIDCEPQLQLDIVFSDTDSHSTHPAGSTTLSLMIAVSENASSGLPAVQSTGELMQPTEVITQRSPSPRAGDLPIEAGTSVGAVAENQTEMSRTLECADEAMDTLKTWKSAIGVIKRVMDHIGPIVKFLPHASPAWELLSKIPETFLQQFQQDDNVRSLLQAIHDAFEFLIEADVLRNMEPASTQVKILDEMLECVSECATFIISYAEDVHIGKRILKNILHDVNEKVQDYRTKLIRLRDNFHDRAAVITEAAVLDVLDAELSALIRDLPYKGGWRFGDEKRCLEGTREDFLDHIVKWVENRNSKRGLVLLGQAGTGKSSIAHEIARRFHKRCLGSYLAFLRREGSKYDAYQLFTTLARDLSDQHPTFKRALGKVIKDDSALRGSRDYRTLFEHLLLEPLSNLSLPCPILIIIDALDESGDTNGHIGLHTFLARRLVDLPSTFRILITSRPEDGIESAFKYASSVSTLYMDDVTLASKTEQDISLYLQKQLPPDIFKEHGVKLAKASEGLFQWAAVACGFINGSPTGLGLGTKKRVQRLLGHARGPNGEGLLDNLYEEVLNEYFKTDEAQSLFRTIMGQLFAAFESLSIESLIALRRHAPIDDPEDSEPVLEILRHLGSLLSNVTSSDKTHHPIIPLHTSFRDFLRNKTSNVFYVDLADAHHQLAHSCLGLMLNDLKFNICKLESSYLANSDFPDIDSRIARYISPALSYACIFWGNHLEHIDFEHDIFAKLKSLVEAKFLFWLEVLSIKSRVGLASPALSSLLIWLQLERPRTKVKKLLVLAKDASAFVRYFGMAMARSAPHIYVSALPFAPTSSRIRYQYLYQCPRTLTLECGQLSHWPALEMTIQAHHDCVICVAFSPDGQHIASASKDRTIQVWDATTGQVIAGPFTGHTDSVLSIAFSPDGQRIASASEDRTVRVWDATTGQVVVGPFTGHTDWVTSVAFSPDGQHIASASHDRTIRVWDATTGQVVAGPCTGHTSSVTSIAFSPDGQRIASASHDGTICVWDATTSQVVAGPFTRHTNSVTSVAFSPDGQCIASASCDRTIRVWDATIGHIVAGPFTGHTNWVTSIAFSPDGQCIASASTDHTIRVWDATTGQVVVGPFTGHTNWVTSVSFSPDGQRIASASYDGTIRVWNATTEQVVTDPFTGHTGCVTSVAFSSDGQRIASASFDLSIRVWDATTGNVVAGPLTGHTGSITFATFSPDGQRIASASFDRTIRVWNATTGHVITDPFIGHTGSVACVTFSPDGQYIASASWDDTIRVWYATTGRVVAGPFTRRNLRVRSIAFLPDGQCIALTSENGAIQVLDVTTGQVIASPFTAHTRSVASACSPDGQHIACVSEYCTIRVWNATTGQVIVVGPLTGHTHSVRSIAISPDGQRIASVSDDDTICVWNATTGHAIAGPFSGHAQAGAGPFSGLTGCISFSPDGQCVASAVGDHTIWVWDATAVTSIVSSPDRQDTASGSDDDAIDGVVKIEGIRHHFTDQSLISGDGWIYGEKEELVLWIPELHRPCLHRPSTIWVAGEHETRLDFSKFVCGPNWATVYDHNLSR